MSLASTFGAVSSSLGASALVVGDVVKPSRYYRPIRGYSKPTRGVVYQIDHPGWARVRWDDEDGWETWDQQRAFTRIARPTGLKLTTMLPNGQSHTETIGQAGRRAPGGYVPSFDGLGGARRWKYNQKDYAFYIVRNDHILSGWSYREDATEALRDLPAELRQGATIWAKITLQRRGINPDDDQKWRAA